MLDLAVERSRCDLVRLRRRKAIELWRGDRGEVGSPDDGLRFGHDDGADLHVVNGEKCHPCERYLQHQVNGDEIGEA